MAIKPPTIDYSVPEAPRVDAWRKSVADSIQASTETPQRSHVRTVKDSFTQPGVVVNNVITTPAAPVVVTRVRPEEPTQISSRAIVGTVLGAAAGAAVAWAMTQGDEQNRHDRKSPDNHAMRMIETKTARDPPRKALEYSAPSRHNSIANAPRTSSRIINIENAPRSHASANRPYSHHYSDQENADIRSVDKISVGGSHLSNQKVSRQADSKPMPPSEIRSARNIPLPQSTASRATRQSKLDDLRTVTPRDSISQVSTRHSKATRKPTSHHNDHERRNRRGSKVGSRFSGYKAMGERGSVPGF